MFGRNKRHDPKLDENIDMFLENMVMLGAGAEEYEEQLKIVERLNRLKTGNSDKRLSHDTIAVVIGNILCVVIIVAYEQKHVMASKATAFVARMTTRTGSST